MSVLELAPVVPKGSPSPAPAITVDLRNLALAHLILTVTDGGWQKNLLSATDSVACMRCCKWLTEQAEEGRSIALFHQPALLGQI
jgi:hypothetical protein